MKRKDKPLDKRVSIPKLVLGTTFFCGAAALSISLPFVLKTNNENKLNINYDINSLVGNKNRVVAFIDNLKNDNSILKDCLKVYGKENVIGTENVELTSEQRSFVSVKQCDELKMFRFEFPSAIKYLLNKEKIKAKVVYIKPNYSGGTYPVIGIKFYSGSNQNYFESIYEYNDIFLNGFKQNNEQLFINQIIDDIEKNPKNFFELKQSVGGIGQLGVYAKNIKVNDFNFNNAALTKLRNHNFYISITSVSVDQFNRENLNLFYDIVYDDGNLNFYKTYNKVVLEGFDVELGVDDPKSVVKNFIKNNKDFINNLSQYFSYKIPVDENGKELPKVSVREAFEKNQINFETTYSIDSKLESNGITLEFKKFENEDPNKLSAFNYEFNSKTPMYRLYISSYSGTPFEYTEDVLIEGINQTNNFSVSQQESDIKKVDEFLRTNNKFMESYIDIDWTMVTFSNSLASVHSINEIPFSVFYNAFQNYKNDPKNNPLPYKLIFKRSQEAINDPEIEQIINQIILSMNELPSEKIIENVKMNETKKQIEINFGLGKLENNLYLNLYTMIVENFDNAFANQSQYDDAELNNLKTFINSNPNNVQINLNNEHGQMSLGIMVDLIRNFQWNKIFSSITHLNVSDNVIKFPELESEIQVLIDFEKLNQLTKEQIETIITNQTINIPIVIIKNNSQQYLTIEKNFQQLLN